MSTSEPQGTASAHHGGSADASAYPSARPAGGPAPGTAPAPATGPAPGPATGPATGRPERADRRLIRRAVRDGRRDARRALRRDRINARRDARRERLVAKYSTSRGWLTPLILLSIVLYATAAPVSASVHGVPVALALLACLVQCAAIPVAVRRPGLAIVFSALAIVALASAGPTPLGDPWPVSVTTIIAHSLVVAIVSFVARWEFAVVSWIVGVASALVLWPAFPDEDGLAAADLTVFAAITGGVLLLALLARQRQTIGAQLVVEKGVSAAEQARRELAENARELADSRARIVDERARVADERTRIARELHDVVAHGLSLVQVQATSARYRLPDLAPEAADEFDSIAATSRAALAEMRQLLGVLRMDSGPEYSPQAGLARLPDLVDAVRRSGTTIDVDLPIDLDAIRLDTVADLTAYRVVQEALSNAVRHAPAAAVRVVVRVVADGATPGIRSALEIVVENGSSSSPPTPPHGGGHGIIGIRERVGLAGGTVEIGETDARGWRVGVTLPVAPTQQQPTPSVPAHPQEPAP